MNRRMTAEWAIFGMAVVGSILAIALMIGGCSEGGDVSVTSNANSGSDQQNQDNCTQTCGCNDGGEDASCCPGCN